MAVSRTRAKGNNTKYVVGKRPKNLRSVVGRYGPMALGLAGGVLGAAVESSLRAVKFTVLFAFDQWLKDMKKLTGSNILQCKEDTKKTEDNMFNYTSGMYNSGIGSGLGQVLGGGLGLIGSGLINRDNTQYASFNSTGFSSELGTPGGPQTCYKETKDRRPGSGEFGEDRCAELLDKPPNQDMSNATTIMLNEIEAKSRAANNRMF